MKTLPSMQHSTGATESSTRESQESLLELQLNKKYTYKHHKIIEVVS